LYRISLKIIVALCKDGLDYSWMCESRSCQACRSMNGFHTLTIWKAQLRFLGLWPMLDGPGDKKLPPGLSSLF